VATLPFAEAGQVQQSHHGIAYLLGVWFHKGKLTAAVEIFQD